MSDIDEIKSKIINVCLEQIESIKNMSVPYEPDTARAMQVYAQIILEVLQDGS